MPGDPPNDDSIWPWSGYHDKKGYGHFGHNGRLHLAHRISYTIFIGPIPNGLIVRHDNDIPIDVNPRNLRLGTRGDNNKDWRERGKSVKVFEILPTLAGPPQAQLPFYKPKFIDPLCTSGERNGRAVLTEEQVLEIRARYAEGNVGYRYLGQEYGVSANMIMLIVKRINWTHI